MWLKESGPIEGWQHFSESLKIRFGPSIYEDPVGAFTKLKQIKSVEEYQTDFENLSNKVKGITEEFRISTFISGLKDELKLMVTMFKPNTLSAAFGLAKLQEEEVNRRRSGASARTFNAPNFPSTKPNYTPNVTNSPTSNGPNFKMGNRTALVSLPGNPKRTIFPIRRLTPTQMQEHREKGLCYNCDEKYHYGHKCSKPTLYLLEGLENTFEEEKEFTAEGQVAVIQSPAVSDEATEECGELLKVSLHAIVGANSPQTMRVRGKVNHQSLCILIDTGSTHNFVDPHIAQKCKLEVEKNQLTVRVANGHKLLCQGQSRGVHLQIGNFLTQANLYLLPLGGCDMILGVDWLQTLGIIHWNLPNLTMEFQNQGKEYLLEGIK